MKESKYFMIVIGVLALIYSIYQFVILIINKEKIEYTYGVIVKTNTVVPKTMKKNNSKWATIYYEVDGKMITSENKIQVSMSNEVGDKIKIAYFINNPAKLFTASFKKSLIFLIVAIISFIVALYIN